MPPGPQKEYHNAHVLTWPARPRRRGPLAAVGVPSSYRGRLRDPAGPAAGRSPGTALSYTKFVADVSAGMVRAVTISPAGQVTGSLAGGQPFTTTIPVALGGNGLAGDLAAHHVQVTATTATSSSLLSVLIGLLPLLLFGGLLYLVIRKAPVLRRRPQRAGRPGQGEGAGHRRRTAGHPVHRRRRLRRGEDGDQ